ncbi:hypothetical protein V6N13_008135 [Hibiscus sabdariffa]
MFLARLSKGFRSIINACIELPISPSPNAKSIDMSSITLDAGLEPSLSKLNHSHAPGINGQEVRSLPDEQTTNGKGITLVASGGRPSKPG